MMALFGGFAQPREQEHYRLPILHTSSAMPLETAWGLTAAICSFAALRISWLAHISTQPHTKRSHHHSRPSQRRHCFTQQGCSYATVMRDERSLCPASTGRFGHEALIRKLGKRSLKNRPERAEQYQQIANDQNRRTSGSDGSTAESPNLALRLPPGSFGFADPSPGFVLFANPVKKNSSKPKGRRHSVTIQPEVPFAVDMLKHYRRLVC